MTVKRKRDKVIAEITLYHLLRLACEQGLHLSREQALVFLNEESAYEMWKHMMRAGEEAAYFGGLSAPNDRETDAAGPASSPLPYTQTS